MQRVSIRVPSEGNFCSGDTRPKYRRNSQLGFYCQGLGLPEKEHRDSGLYPQKSRYRLECRIDACFRSSGA